MNLTCKAICAILTIASFNNANIAESEEFYKIVFKLEKRLIDLNNIDNIVNILNEILLNIHYILNYNNEINIAMDAFIQNNYSVHYDKLNKKRIENLNQYKNNFIMFLFNNYNISIKHNESLNTVSQELCNECFSPALYYNNINTVNSILDISLQRTKDNTRKIKETLDYLKHYHNLFMKRQMFEYLEQSFYNVIMSKLNNDIKYLKDCLEYLLKYFGSHPNYSIRDISYKFQQIITNVLEYLYNEQECLRNLCKY